MANATVEKIQALGLKHGEKAVVGLAVVLFFAFVFSAITRKTIELTPEELQKKAESAESNLSARQKPEDILAKLETLGVKPQTEFEVAVEKQQSKALNPTDYVVKSKWVTPEPGAGLIRGQPALLAPTNLYAFPNRGGYLVYALNEKGERIPDDGKGDTKTRRTRLGKPRGRGRGGMMGSGGGSMMGAGSGMPGMMGGGGTLTAKQKEQAERQRKEDEARLSKALVGKVDDTKKAKADDKSAPESTVQVTYKETTKGYRSVVVTATLDNKTLKENYLEALKSPELGYPNYKRVDAQRQTLNPDGTWGEFEDVNADKNLAVLDNLPEVDEELVPEAPGPRLDSLVDPLPFPRAGYWGGVHVANLVPKDKREIPKPAAGGMMGPGMYGAGMGSGAAMDSAMGPPGGMSGRYPGMGSGGGMPGMGPGMGSGMGPGMGSGMGPGMGSGGGMYGGGMMGSGATGGNTGPVDETDFQKSESDEVMVRSIDFTVQPETTYRFRLRIVVVNPNYLRNDVSPGVDTEATELKGPWSEPSNDVTVPADVSAYAMSKFGDNRRKDQVRFQVVRWNPDDGHTLTRTDEAGPGELIGTLASTPIPSSDGAGKKNSVVNFNSRQIVLDSMGGIEPAPSSLKGIAPFDVPAVSIAMRPDGIVTVHDQARDVSDDVRIEMDKSYKKALKDSTKKREPGMMGMMGSGMMGSGGR